jgi:hypothetical protein
MEQTHDGEEIIEPLAALDVGKATLVSCAAGAPRRPAGASIARGDDVIDHDPLVDRDGRPHAKPGRDTRRNGSRVGLLETGALWARGARVGHRPTDAHIVWLLGSADCPSQRGPLSCPHLSAYENAPQVRFRSGSYSRRARRTQ